MQGLVVIVLVLCCVNVSGLMLSKLHERQHEFAVRTAIGAGSLRLMRQYLTEALADRARRRRARRRGGLVWQSRCCCRTSVTRWKASRISVQPDRMVFLVTTCRRSRRR